MPGRVLVTGGASGIGAATCRVLADADWDVLAADVTATDGVIRLDVTDEAAWDQVLDGAGPLAGLVNCAGIRTRSSITDTSVEEFQRHMQVNVVGTWLGIRGFLRRHQPGTTGAIVNVSSVNAEIAVPDQAHYVASKGAVSALTRAAAVEAAPLGVRVNAVAPGPVRTPMTAERLGDPEQAAWLDSRVPMGRVAEPTEIAEVISFLLSDKSSYITGEVLFTDGGWHGNA
ncbi:MAG: SDR family oxidoreductase [Acidimicrobiia bacterium]|nr:SDR family oxidoreductase [Acidimicrobiia bacterium]MYG71778.1 SDR family oxidoreductase [Acidimicrobiia bacterium]MYH96022.1 SDR family oxidoreductase [Acidimicrobiia bacterium]MYL08129.1 SDR family oxidoreductase [Acidimicrobiia bacterium]